MKAAGELDRRAFLLGTVGAGCGLALGLALPIGPEFTRAAPAAAASEINCWVTIAPDDTVTLRIARSEMGQGILTGLAMLVAEELQCDWANVRTEFVSPRQNLLQDRIWGDLSTGASRSIATSQDYLRRAGATAREMLIAAAAARWNVPASQCSAQNSTISHSATGRRLTFGAVADAAAKIAQPADVQLKRVVDWTLAGKPTKRLDVPDKVTGQPIYGIDVRLPGMLYAAIAQCPVFGGTLKSVDESLIQAMKGVRRIVRMPDAVAVIADSWWQARCAVQALHVTWDDSGNGRLSTADIRDFVHAGLDMTGQIGRANGDFAAGLAHAAQRVEADYVVPFLAHATMEPQTCTAHVRRDGVEIWVPTQDASTALATAAFAAGVSDEQVTVHRTMLGGGFGRRGAIQEYIRQAVLIAKEVEQPVKLVWSREEDVQHDLYRPFGMARLVAGLGADGMPIAWSIRLAGPSFVAAILRGNGSNFVDNTFISGLAAEMPYDVPNYLLDYVVRETPVPLGVWRAINYTQNAFYKESFVDEMAHAAGIDPYHYRRLMLRNSPKNLAVLDAAAAKAGWSSPPPPGVFRGIALNEACGSYCAQVVEVSIKNGRVRVHRVVAAIDCGHAVNPLSIEMQTEGAIVYALTAALYGEITIKDGAAVQSNFDTYQMLRIGEVPKVETVIVPSGDFWGGVGEPPVPPLAPALCNAVFAATGRRIRSLPLKNHDLSQQSAARTFSAQP
jgi:isoquinoline 1-oxidoreductase subunit beta